MKTAMQQLWKMLDDAEQNGVFEVGTQNFKRYIEGIFLEKEKQQIIDAFKRGLINEMKGIEELTSEQYHSETFNNND